MPHILASDYAVDILVKDLHPRHRSRDANCVGNSAARAGPRHKPPAHVYDSVANKGDVPRETRSKMYVHFDVR
jgi:hypothetical protein